MKRHPEPEPEETPAAPALVVEIRRRRPPTGQLIGTVRDMRPSQGAVAWPPPEDDDLPAA
jgi:hypothetical protein